MKPDETLWDSKPRPIDVIIGPFQRFAHQEAAGGVLLILFTAIALGWANSPWSDSYHAFWHGTNLTVGFGNFVLSEPVELWINDGLMAVFFFVVGLEIKREILAGELASPRRAMFPIAGAVGGMIAPALIYAALNAGTPEISGWGVPMATDIAFALGVLALIGDRVPTSLKVFLAALAIVDDLGAVLVIALFYTTELSLGHLAAGGVFLALMIAANGFGVRKPLVYAVLGVGLWLAFLQSGVHATIAGVLAALSIPARTAIDERKFVGRGRTLLDRLEREVYSGGSAVGMRQSVVQSLEAACEEVEAPLQRLERGLHPWVAFFIMPVFALANAGVHLGTDFVGNLAHPSSMGIVLGLVIGKQVGIITFTWLSVRVKLASLPAGASWKLVYGVGWLGGIGFTMSLFIAALAFPDAATLEAAKAGVLTASLMAGVSGYFVLKSSAR